MSNFTTGKHAFGFSDRSGFRYPLKGLVEQNVNGQPSGLFVGRDEVDIDHEQLRIGEVDASDSQTLENPRPDKEIRESRALFSWNPVGSIGLEMKASVGRVSTS